MTGFTLFNKSISTMPHNSILSHCCFEHSYYVATGESPLTNKNSKTLHQTNK